MPTEIDRAEVQRLVARGVPLVEVLSKKEFEEEHIAGATNIPLTTLDGETTAQLEKDRPVITYCYDSQ